MTTLAMKRVPGLRAQRNANRLKAALKRNDLPLPGSEEALAELSAMAAQEMRLAEHECIRTLARELLNHSSGYAEPQGKMIDGVWEPDPIQYFPAVAGRLARELEKDRADGGCNFAAKQYCKSWNYCSSLAAAAFSDNNGPTAPPMLPDYVSRASLRANFPAIRERYAQKAAKHAAERARVFEKAHAIHASKTPAAKRAQRIADAQKKVARINDAIKKHERAIKGLKTRLKRVNASLRALARAISTNEGKNP